MNKSTSNGKVSRSPITICEVDHYRQVLGPLLTEADVDRQEEMISAHRIPLGCILVDTDGGILTPYPLWDAVQRITSRDPEWGERLTAQLIAGAQVVEVADRDAAATCIRATTLSQSLGTRSSNQLIADQVLQQVRWIAGHRAEIDARNKSYAGRPIRPSASWIGSQLHIDNKRVERLYHAPGNRYGLVGRQTSIDG